MLTLYLLRHAKSSWSNPELQDFDRPLNQRGKASAPKMAAYMRAQGLIPGLVLCSAARRARQTWDLVAETLEEEVPLKVYRSLYLASPARLLETLRRQPDGQSPIMMIGHNPGMERLAARLAGPGSDRGALAEVEAKFPTAALAEICFDETDWTRVSPGKGRLLRCVKPKALA